MSTKSEKARERAERAQALVEQERRKAKRMMIIKVVGVAVAMIAIVAVLFGIGQMGNDEPTAKKSSHSLAIGPKDAPHHVIIYEDFLCPICGQLESASHRGLAKAAAAGDVRVEYRPFVLLDRMGPYSELATSAFAVVQEKSGDKVAKKFHDLLYANQPEEEGPFPKADSLVDLAVQAGAKKSEVEKPITDLDGKDWADAATQQAVNAGVRGTPTILLDGKPYQDGRDYKQIGTNLVKAVS